jgi:hypothetical protein
MRLSERKRRLLLILCAFAASFVLALAAIVVIRHYKPPGEPAVVPVGLGGYLAPAGLDTQWESTCADRAGGDGVSAVRLSSSQIAWFFSDSSLGPAGPRTGLSKQSGFVHNLVVMQTIEDSGSRLVTITGGNACPGPGQRSHARAVVSPSLAGGPENQRYWTGDGLRIGSSVLHFYSRYLPGALVPTGTVIADFPVSELARAGNGPAYGAVIKPSITRLPSYVPPGGGTPIVWGASVLRRGGTIYVYGWQDAGSGPLTDRGYLARVAVSRLTDFAAWRFSAGNGRWAAGQDQARPVATSGGLIVDTGFSVIWAAGRYWLIEQVGGLGGPDIDAYPGPAPWGPFDSTAAVVLYHAPGIGLSAADHYDVMYDALAEPSLSSRGKLLISYDVNSLAVTSGCVSLSSYTNAVVQPRFIRVPLTDFLAGRDPASPLTAAAGRPPNPLPASKHQPLWFDSWSYRGGCPPLSAVAGLSATRAQSSVRVRWQASGPGVRYDVYVRSGGGDYVLRRTTGRASVTLSDLTDDTRYEVLVVPENARHQKGPGASVSVRAALGLE